jgi:hypothetical protein
MSLKPGEQPEAGVGSCLAFSYLRFRTICKATRRRGPLSFVQETVIITLEQRVIQGAESRKDGLSSVFCRSPVVERSGIAYMGNVLTVATLEGRSLGSISYT